jgi:glycosyltransferase involved in cell wall biosynthesis
MLIAGLRMRARRRRIVPGGVTVVTVNWNSTSYLSVLLDAVRRFSGSADVRFLVVDNGSSDGSRRYLWARRDVRAVYLPWNMGHARALDIGFLLSDTEFVIALDVDAFPIRDDWLHELLDPLRHGCTISGARLWRDYVHPCCLAMRLERFIRLRHSFEGRYVPGDGVRPSQHSVGEDMSTRDGGRLNFLPVTSQLGPGDVGTVFGDVVYHNFYSTRFASHPEGNLDVVVGRDDPARAWARALEMHLGAPPPSRAARPELAGAGPRKVSAMRPRRPGRAGLGRQANPGTGPP